MASFQEPAELQPYASESAASEMIFFDGAHAEPCDNSASPQVDVAGLTVEDTSLCRESLQHLQVQQQFMQAQLSLILQQNHYGGAWSVMQPAPDQPAVHRRRNRKGLKRRLRLRERAAKEFSTAEEATASDTHVVFDSSDGRECANGATKNSLSRVALLRQLEDMQARLHAAEAEWTRAEQALLDRAEMAEQYAGRSEDSIRQSSARIAELGQQIQESQDHASEQFTRACLLDASLGDAMQRIADLEATVGRGLGDLRAAEDQAKASQLQAEAAEYRVQMAAERAETAEKRIVELEKSWGRELGKVTALEAVVSDSAAHIEALQTELEQTQECLGQVELQYQIATSQVQQTMKDLDDAKQQTLWFQKCAGSEVARAEVAESRVKKLKERTAELEQHLVTAHTCAGSEVARAKTAEWRVAELEAAFGPSYAWEYGEHI